MDQILHLVGEFVEWTIAKEVLFLFDAVVLLLFLNEFECRPHFVGVEHWVDRRRTMTETALEAVSLARDRFLHHLWRLRFGRLLRICGFAEALEVLLQPLNVLLLVLILVFVVQRTRRLSVFILFEQEEEVRRHRLRWQAPPRSLRL